MKALIAAIWLLAGCSSILEGYRSVEPRAENRAGIYSITTLYGGSVEAREHAWAWLDTDAENLCNSPYELISEETVPIMNRLGETIASRLIWKIKCKGADESLAPEKP